MMSKRKLFVLAVIFSAYAAASFSQALPPVVVTPPHTVIPVAAPPDAVPAAPKAKCAVVKNGKATHRAKTKKCAAAQPKKGANN
jgi:hypothetical protein